MHKIADFIMSRKFLPVVLALTAMSIFWGFSTRGGSNTNDDNPKARHAKILRNVGILLEEGHYKPQKIDDAFSKEVLTKFLKDLDNDKNYFIQADIDAFNKFSKTIDDEIHGAPLESFYSINDIYTKRVNEVSQLYKDYLARPFNFTKDEDLERDGDKLAYPKNIAERNDRWRKQLKMLVLEKFVSGQEEREKNKGKKDFVVKADSTLEREAREQVSKQFDRFFTTKKNRETQDYDFSIFVNAITGAMDPHTDYMPPIDLRTFKESMKGSFFGIGAQLKEDDGKIKIGTLVSGGPAWKSGELKENDEIIKVGQGAEEPVDVTGYSVTDAVKLIRGSTKGSEVRLTLKRVDGTIKVVSLLRDDIKLEDTFARSAIINGTHKIGYIYLPEFYADFDKPNGARSAKDVALEVEKLKNEKVEGIVLDLRGNGGGSLYDVVEIAGLFIDEGPVVQVKGRSDKSQVLKDKNRGVLYDGPLAVLVDETSASASEIFAAAMQDYKRGIIVGSTSTYGKGTVQRNIPLNPENEIQLFGSNTKDDLGTVKLTLQKFYRINGDATQLRGVVPDVILPDRYDFLKIREKDNPYSLKWDETGKADYSTWSNSSADTYFIAGINDDVNKSSTFSKIKSNVQWLDKNLDRNFSLNINKYKQEKQKLVDINKQLDDLYKLPVPMKVSNIPADSAAINSAADKADSNNKWLKALSSDIFIDETVKIISKMIEGGNMARKD